ncbi:ABC transporter ATP-binding protein [Dankookia sp. P2]|uniref:ABC transporter ATP-binding protein n=1 Tax=Dankookia sp. P2 TaxID=3423955 RepID=UPI003D67EB92
MATLEVEALQKSFGGVQAVRGVSFAVQPGEMLALIGPNGAGKSTCFNMLNGQLRPDAGRVRLLGQDITGLAPRQVWRLGVGRTFQITATFGSMTVLENVQMALLSHHRRLGQLWTPVSRMDRAPAEAPAGPARHGGAGGAPLRHPRLWRPQADRAGRRARQRAQAAADGRAHRRHGAAGAGRSDGADCRHRPGAGIAVLFTEHDMDVVFSHADRILVLDRGALIAEGAPATVRADPRVREVYLGSGATQGGH